MSQQPPRVVGIHAGIYPVELVLEDVERELPGFSQGLFIGLRKDGDVRLFCSSMTFAQLCFLKCALDNFVSKTLSGENR